MPDHPCRRLPEERRGDRELRAAMACGWARSPHQPLSYRQGSQRRAEGAQMTNDPLFTTEKWRPRSEKGAETPAAEPPRGNGADRHTAAAPAKPKLLICLGDKPPTPPSHLV